MVRNRTLRARRLVHDNLRYSRYLSFRFMYAPLVIMFFIECTYLKFPFACILASPFSITS